MKTVIATLAVLLAAHGAEAESVNSGNSNNTIIIKPQITVKSGCCGSCKRKTKVVEKVVEKKVVETVYVDRPVVVEKVVEKTVVKRVQKKNRISLLGGAGPTHMENDPAEGRVNLYRSAVGGGQYQRSLDESWSIGAQVLTNQTVLGMVGYEF